MNLYICRKNVSIYKIIYTYIYIHIICIYIDLLLFSRPYGGWYAIIARPDTIYRAKQQQQWLLCWLLFDQADRPTPLVLYILYGWCEQTPHVVKMHETNKSENKKLDTGITGTNKWANIQVNIGPYSSKSLQMPFEKALFAMLVCPSADTLTSEFSRLTDDQPSTAAKGLNF